MRIALDAMGTDDHPRSEVAGAVEALRGLGEEFTVLLVGDRSRIHSELSRHKDVPRGRLKVVHAEDRILSDEPPALTVRRKPKSSIVVALKLLKSGEADAFVSAGSTGAVMAASLLLLRALPGVDRPAIGTLIPTMNRATLLLDAGANVDCKPRHLLQFARLGNIYAQDLMGRERPRVGLLNIGEEPEKGDDLARETHAILQESDLNFVGNIEGREIIRGISDVVVCDGFVGNVLLKFYESVAEFIIGLLRKEMRDFQGEVHLEEIVRVLDYAEYGGAPLLGVNGVSVICHGQSPPKAVRNALGVAHRAVRSGMVARIARELAEDASKEPA